jgi:t-SNARE complex subunit (syntaxin)
MRTSKKNKPYFVCDACGVQVFVRRTYGIEKLTTLLKELQHRDIYTRANSPEFLRILAINNEMSATKAEIKKIKEKVFLLMNNEEEAAVEALERRLKNLSSELGRLGTAQR